MKFTSFTFGLLLLCVWSAYSFASPISVPTTITHVTVYNSGAKITATATANVPLGNSEIVLEGLSQYVNSNSLQVTIEGGATLLSVAYAVNQFNLKNDMAVKPLQDSVLLLEKKVALLNKQRQVYEQENNFLVSSLSKLGTAMPNNGATVLTTTEVNSMADLFRKRSLELETLLLNNSNETDDNNRKLAILQERIQKTSNPDNRQPQGTALLTVLSNSATNIKITIDYWTTNVFWKPLYDVRYLSPDKPVSLTYKAAITQNTGFDWERIKLSLATGTPTANNSRPILNTSYIDFTNSYNEANKPKAEFNPFRSNMYNDRPAYKDGENNGEAELQQAPVYQVTSTEYTVNTVFDINLPQSIPSDKQQHIVMITNYDIPATYRYHSVPKLDNGAYLLARITNWGQYNLVAGTANLFMEDTYIGQSPIAPNTTADTLSLSLGRDEKISVKRLDLNEYSAVQFFGTNKKQTYAYEFIVRNGKSSAVTIDILDQIPLSRQADIKVELEEKSGASYDADLGSLLWSLHLKPNEIKRFKFIYSIKSPKERMVITHN
jgi:uncharacterized protein (TIGR02231 family)